MPFLTHFLGLFNNGTLCNYWQYVLVITYLISKWSLLCWQWSQM